MKKWAITLLLVVSCSRNNETVAEPPVPTPDPEDHAGKSVGVLEKEREALFQEILSLTRDRSCNADADCDYALLGSNPKGGHWNQWAYSKLHTDTEALGKSVERYNAVDLQINVLKGVSSDSSLIIEPASCIENMCYTGQPIY